MVSSMTERSEDDGKSGGSKPRQPGLAPNKIRTEDVARSGGAPGAGE